VPATSRVGESNPPVDLPDGWLSSAEARALHNLAQGRLVLEIGSWLGRSTVAMARVADHVVAVDHHHGSAEHRFPTGEEADTLRGFIGNLERYDVRDKVTVCVMDAARLTSLFREDVFDLVFVDGAHDFGSALRDGLAALKLVKLRSVGLVAFHDYNFPDVRSAIKHLPYAPRELEILPDTNIALLR
jgi:predicted O-methyltransferase YrrM